MHLQIVLSGEAREKHVAAARAGKVLTREEVAETYNDWTLDGWANACPIGAPLRNVDRVDQRLEEKRIWSATDARGAHGLIVNHTETMDLCLNPEGQLIHGFTSWSVSFFLAFRLDTRRERRVDPVSCEVENTGSDRDLERCTRSSVRRRRLSILIS